MNAATSATSAASIVLFAVISTSSRLLFLRVPMFGEGAARRIGAGTTLSPSTLVAARRSPRRDTWDTSRDAADCADRRRPPHRTRCAAAGRLSRRLGGAEAVVSA